MKKTITTLALVTLSGSAFAQSGLDIDRAYAAELRADANTRSSLLGSNAAGLDAQIFTQFRYTYNDISELNNGTVLGDNETTVGFSAPRTQIRLSGAVEGTDLSGHISFDFGGAFDHGFSGGAAGDGGATLRDAYAAWGLDDNWTFLFGQLKNPLFFESNVAPEFSQGVERSLTNSFFDVGYTQGIALNYTDDEWKFTVALTDGPALYKAGTNASNSYFTSLGEAEVSITGRLDWLVSGSWDQFADFASWRGSNDGFRVGAGVHWSEAGGTNPTPPYGMAATVDSVAVTAWTVDASYESDGWGIFAAWQSVNIDMDPIAGASTDRTDNGIVLQGNFFFNDQFEGFARYDIIMLDDDATALFAIPATADDQYSMFTLGFNYYLVPESHAARFSMDVGFGLDDTTGLDALGAAMGPAAWSDASTTGYVGGGASAGAEDEFMLRGQFSLLF